MIRSSMPFEIETNLFRFQMPTAATWNPNKFVSIFNGTHLETQFLSRFQMVTFYPLEWIIFRFTYTRISILIKCSSLVKQCWSYEIWTKSIQLVDPIWKPNSQKSGFQILPVFRCSLYYDHPKPGLAGSQMIQRFSNLKW